MFGLTDEQSAAIKNYVDTAINSNRKKIIAVIGDSGSCEEPIDGSAWPARLNELFNVYGMQAYEVVSFALGGYSFSQIQTKRDYNNFTKTQIDRVVEINPMAVIVMLGANDFIDGTRTKAQIFNSVTSVFQEIKTRLPNTKILYLHQHFYDSTNFSPSTLKNKGVAPFFFNLKTVGPLANTYNADILDEQVAPSVKSFCANMDDLKNHVKTLATVDIVESVDIFKIARLGGVIGDGLHPNYFGRGLLCMMIAFILKNYFPEMMYRGIVSRRQDIDSLFNALLIRSGDGYFKQVDDVERYNLETASRYKVDLTQWYLPRKINVMFTEKLSVDTGILWVQFMDAYQNTPIEQSVNEAPFSTVAKTNDLGNGVIQLPMFNIKPPPNKGIYRLRWKIGNCVLGPYPIEVN